MDEVYRLTKARKKKIRDLTNARCVKWEDQKVYKENKYKKKIERVFKSLIKGEVSGGNSR